MEMAVLALTVALVLMAEFFNTALEELVNLVEPNVHPVAGLIKNISAGAVLIASVGALVVGLVIFIPRLFNV